MPAIVPSVPMAVVHPLAMVAGHHLRQRAGASSYRRRFRDRMSGQVAATRDIALVGEETLIQGPARRTRKLNLEVRQNEMGSGGMAATRHRSLGVGSCRMGWRWWCCCCCWRWYWRWVVGVRHAVGRLLLVGSWVHRVAKSGRVVGRHLRRVENLGGWLAVMGVRHRGLGRDASAVELGGWNGRSPWEIPLGKGVRIDEAGLEIRDPSLPGQAASAVVRALPGPLGGRLVGIRGFMFIVPLVLLLQLSRVVLLLQSDESSLGLSHGDVVPMAAFDRLDDLLGLDALPHVEQLGDLVHQESYM